MRGRLINPFLISLAQIDTAAIAADPDSGGSLTSGYDKDFREPVVRTVGGVRTAGRKEKTPIDVRCQIEPAVWDALTQVAAGNMPNAQLVLAVHFRDLEAAGMVDANGAATIRVNDRLVSIKDELGNVIQTIPDPPGLFITQVMPTSFGLGRARNLLIVTFEDREHGTRAGSS